MTAEAPAFKMFLRLKAGSELVLRTIGPPPIAEIFSGHDNANKAMQFRLWRAGCRMHIVRLRSGQARPAGQDAEQNRTVRDEYGTLKILAIHLRWKGGPVVSYLSDSQMFGHGRRAGLLALTMGRSPAGHAVPSCPTSRCVMSA